ncbi:MAG: GLUG motif-containing protein, partial [Steroidobacteraceae bacterium]
MGSNIDATPTSTWNSGSGFTPIGNSTNNFTGTFDGLGHTISNLAINLPSASDVGLFGYTGAGSVIQNVGLVGGSVSGSNYVGGLVGWNNGTVSNSYATGSVNGASNVGGLVGDNGGMVSSSYATGSVNGASNVGGLVGDNGGMVSNS